MENNNNNSGKDKYRDFFERDDHETDKLDEQQTHKEADNSNSSSYYGYGPFRSALNEEDLRLRSANSADAVVLTATDPGNESPALERGQVSSSNRMAPVTKAPRKKSQFSRMFVSFMAGVLVVGSLMYTSDRMNWFTGDEVALVQEVSSSVNNGSTASNNDVQKAALNIERPDGISQMVKDSQGAVVKIETYSKTSNSSRRDNDIFNYFFGERNGGTDDSTNQDGVLRQSGTGSGFIFDSSGYILTNQHVLEGASEIKVYVEGYDEPFIATKLGESYELDLAALKIEGSKPFPALKIGDANDLEVGDWVVAIGNPYGFDHTVTVGVLSAKERPITIPDTNGTREYQDLLQTDASINPGNSGGPLLNLAGEVIGINTAVNAEAQGIGFAIPTGTFTVVLDDLKNNTPIPVEPAPYIGVSLGDLTETIAGQLGFSGTKGSLINQVEVGSPAHRAGIRAGDIMTEVSGKEIETSDDVVALIKDKAVGAKVPIKVFRDGKAYEVVVIVGDRNSESN